MSDKISVEAKIDRDDIVYSLTHELSDKEMINFVLNIDEEVCDWDFTLNLLTAIVSRVRDNGTEFASLDEPYHEKSREVIRMLKEITLAPKVDKTMAEE
jgi:hypothetical protein